MIVLVLGGAFILMGLGYFSMRKRGMIPAAGGYMPRFNNPFNGYGGGGPPPFQPQAPTAPYHPVKHAEGMPVVRKQVQESPMGMGMGMMGNPMMMGSGETLDSFFGTGDKLIGTMMMDAGKEGAASSGGDIESNLQGNGMVSLGLSNPLFAQLNAGATKAASVSTDEMKKELKSVVHLISMAIDKMDDKDSTQEMLELANRAMKSWEKVEETSTSSEERSDSERISNLVDVKVTLNKLEQVSYMNIQMPASDKAKLMNIITSVRSKIKSYSNEKSGGKANLKRSSIVASMATIKSKMTRKIMQNKLKF
ncbi:hypothetical protein HOP50_20g86280 [Chloropicon primus]|uniref:Uncharacterized protein n=1 Tax=Chloropicon primus TaxID=1764295 RepID=A0A5B8MZI6_9CHLO|nr:hypothetical protein A3770_20p85950 [Chloropicon primus]UPR05278.1 hypothetical protein HOP50_20g86280 [Chloropicon primus]|eukprot:QDZ26077.1 hypothetical protein A3770_20p85950 [Chloropicon primus]